MMAEYNRMTVLNGRFLQGNVVHRPAGAHVGILTNSISDGT